MDLGQILRDEGMARAVNHADRDEPGWSERAYYCVIQVARRGSIFTSEDVKIYAAIHGLNSPPDARAWGSILRQAAKNGLLRKAGWVNATNPRCHNRPMQAWQISTDL